MSHLPYNPQRHVYILGFLHFSDADATHLVQYAALAEPLYNRRLEIISGKSLPTTEELEKGHTQEVKDKEEFSDSEDEEEAEEEGADPAEKEPSFLPSEPIVDGEPGAAGGIPQFWLTTLRNHAGIAELITERDEKALEHLTDIRYEHLNGEKMGFKLLFEFEENPFFAERILEKTYFYQVSMWFIIILMTKDWIGRAWIRGRLHLRSCYRNDDQLEARSRPHQRDRDQETEE